MLKTFARYEKLRLPILGPLAVALTLLFGVFLFAAAMMQDYRIKESTSHDIAAAKELYQSRIRHNADHLAVIMETLAQDPRFVEKLRQRDRSGLLALSESLFRHLNGRYDITHFYFTGTDRVNILRVHNPPSWGDVIERPSTLLAEQSGQLAWAVEPGVFGSITLRVVRPVYSSGQLVGYFELGREVDYLLPEIGKLLKLNLAIMIDKSFLHREAWESSMQKLGFTVDWNQFPQQVIGAMTDKVLPASLEQILKNGGAPVQESVNNVSVDEKRLVEQDGFMFAFSDLFDGAGRQIGNLVFYKDVKPLYQEKYRFLLEASAVAGTISITLFLLFYVITGKIEREIRTLNSRNRLILEAADEGIVGLDLNGHINFINPAAARMLGYSSEELIGCRYHGQAYRCANEQEKVVEDNCPIHATLKTGVIQRVEQDTHYRKDGSQFPVELISAPIYEEGELVGAVVTFIDISQRLEQLQHIREGDMRMRAIVDNATDGIMTMDRSGRILSLNPAGEGLFGYLSEDVIGHDVSLLFPEVVDRDEEGLKQYLVHAGADNVRRDVEVCRKDGKPISVRLSVNEINLAGERIYMAMMQDITVQKRAEQAIRDHALALERSNQELQNFAYVASHDLQEPLRKIMAFGDRLASHNGADLDEKGLDYLARMRNAAERMRLLISSLLAYSRVESKAQPLQPVELKDVLSDVLSDLESRIAETQGEVLVDELPRVDADPVQMHQLLQNLIANGLKFRSPDETPRVEVRCKILPYGDPEALPNVDVEQTCLIQVKDNGIGFDNKYLDRIFNIFQRLHGRDQYEGSGIGLAICRKIAERHKGVLEADGQSGVGAIFTLKIPVKQPKIPSLAEE